MFHCQAYQYVFHLVCQKRYTMKQVTNKLEYNKLYGLQIHIPRWKMIIYFIWKSRSAGLVLYSPENIKNVFAIRNVMALKGKHWSNRRWPFLSLLSEPIAESSGFFCSFMRQGTNTQPPYIIFGAEGRKEEDGAVGRVLASHQCGRGSIPGLGMRGFSPREPGIPVCPSPRKSTLSNSNLI